MTDQERLLRDAHAVFLPVVDEASIPGHISDHLAAGGTSVLGGVILSDDLDAPGILRGSSLEQAAIEALAAGVDWLLVAGTPNLPNLVAAVAEAVTKERLSSDRLHAAAQAARTLTGDIG